MGFGKSFAETFNPAFRESFRFTSAELAEDEKEKKRRKQLKKASEAQLEAILAVTPKHIKEKVADSVDAPMGAERAGSWDSVSDVFSPKERIDAVIKSAGNKRKQDAMRGVVAQKLTAQEAYETQEKHRRKLAKEEEDKYQRRKGDSIEVYEEKMRLSGEANWKDYVRKEKYLDRVRQRGRNESMQDYIEKLRQSGISQAEQRQLIIQENMKREQKEFEELSKSLGKLLPSTIGEAPAGELGPSQVRTPRPEGFDAYVREGLYTKDGTPTTLLGERLGNKNQVAAFARLARSGNLPRISELGSDVMLSDYNKMKADEAEQEKSDISVAISEVGALLLSGNEVIGDKHVEAQNNPKLTRLWKQSKAAHKLKNAEKEHARDRENVHHMEDLAIAYKSAARSAVSKSDKKTEAGTPTWIIVPNFQPIEGDPPSTRIVFEVIPAAGYEMPLEELTAAQNEANRLSKEANPTAKAGGKTGMGWGTGGNGATKATYKFVPPNRNEVDE